MVYARRRFQNMEIDWFAHVDPWPTFVNVLYVFAVIDSLLYG